jgi:mannosyltransferase OCH1-like enzyme
LMYDTQLISLKSGCKYNLWTLNDANVFLQTHYPYLLHMFNKPMRYNIVKCDMFRYVLMYHFGGMYLDLDFVLVKCINEIFNEQNKDIILFEEWYDSCKKESIGTDGSLHNGCLISKPKQTFWLKLISHIYSNEACIVDKSDVWKHSGTNLLRNIYTGCKDTNSIKLHSYVKMCPYTCTHRITSERKECIREGDIPLSTEESHWQFYNWDYVQKHKYVFSDSYGVCVYIGDGSLWN